MRSRCNAPTSFASVSPRRPPRSAREPGRSAWAFARTSSAAAPTTPSMRSTDASNSGSFPARDRGCGPAPDQPLQALLADAVERLELVDLRQRRAGAAARRRRADGVTPSRQDHLVLAGVLERDELEDLGRVADRLEQQHAQAVRHHLGLLAEMDAMAQQGLERPRARHLRPQLLVAAR